MRLLHVSDLHLGRSLGDLSREPEQRAVVAEMVAAAAEHDVAMTLVSGDVFEAFTPPAWAEDLFFELLDGLAAGGRRAVAVIAGNHDSGLRLAAAEPLARRLGILLAGDVGEPLRGHDVGGGAVRVVPLAAQVARVEVPGAEAAIVAGLLPFLSEAKVARGLEAEARASPVPPASRAGRATPSATPSASCARSTRAPRTAIRRAINVLALHQFVTGGAPSDSERRLRVGALSDLDASAIPAGLDYVALGHLHRPQTVAGAGSPALYAGSPIAYSFSEAGQDKRAVLVDVTPGRAAVLTDVPLRGGRPLEIWAISSVEEARARAEATRARPPIVEVRVNLGRPLPAAEGDALFALPDVTVLSVRDLFDPHPSELAARSGDELPEVRVEELFCELWARKHSAAPDEETLAELRSALLALGQTAAGAPG